MKDEKYQVLNKLFVVVNIEPTQTDKTFESVDDAWQKLQLFAKVLLLLFGQTFERPELCTNLNALD